MDYLLIDGNNLAIRSAFANDYMANSAGVASGAHYGFFNSLLNLKKRFPGHQMLVAWDSGSKRRKEESKIATEQGLIKEGYKANRKRGEIPKPLADWFETGNHLKNALSKTGIPQITVQDFEADDVIATYCENLKEGNEIVVVTSDKDFYQLLDDTVIVWDGMKEDYITKETFKEEYGITPLQHVHVGALMGDNSDNIFGVPGWGEKTAISAIQKQGSWEAIVEGLEKQFADEEELYSELTPEEFAELAKKETPKGKLVYPEIYEGQPHIGLLKGFDSKKIKISKREIMLLLFKDRVKLAFSLKEMDKDISELPEITPLDKDKEKLLEYFDYYDIVSLVERVDALFN